MASIKIKGDTSGSTTITAPATGGDESIELSTALAAKLPYSYGTATPTATDDGFLWYDENDTPPTPKFWDGAAFQALTSGKVLQVVQATTTSAVTIASTSDTDTGLSGSITPSSASNKVLVIVEQAASVSRNSTGTSWSLGVKRDGTFIYGRDQAYEEQIIVGGASSFLQRARFTRVYLDSPNSTSSVTYKTQAAVETTANSSQVVCQTAGIESVILLMEIAA